MKILGKPYAGKLHVRFDEGVEEDKVRKCGSTLYRLPSSSLLYREINFELTKRKLRHGSIHNQN